MCVVLLRGFNQGQLAPPGTKAGELTPAAAALFGLKPGTAVATATIDAHSGVPGAV